MVPKETMSCYLYMFFITIAAEMLSNSHKIWWRPSLMKPSNGIVKENNT